MVEQEESEFSNKVDTNLNQNVSPLINLDQKQ